MLNNRSKPVTVLKRSLRQLAHAWLAICLLPGAFAHELESDPLRLSGFATVGVTKGGNNKLGYRREVSREGVFDGHWTLKTDTLLGAQLDIKFTDTLDGAIQVIAKDRIDHDLDKSVEWAYFRYRPNPDITARIGRIGMDIFMLSEYRNLGIAYLWARPPVEFYGPIAFDYFEGIDLTHAMPLGRGTLRSKIFGGSSENNFEVLGEGANFKLNNLIGFSIDWESSHWHAKFTVADIDFDRSLNTAIGMNLVIDALTLAEINGWTEAATIRNDLEVDNQGVTYHAIGLAYDNSAWSVQSEISYLNSDYDLLKPYIGRYLSVGYKIGSSTIYGLIAKANQSESREKVPELPGFLQAVPDLVALQQGIQHSYDRNYIDQHSVSAGLRWDIRYDMAIKFQWDRTWVEAIGGTLWEQKPGTVTDDETLDTYSINMNFIF